MLPHKHLMLSALIGAVAWWRTRNAAAPTAVLTAVLAAGVLPDIDHAADYAVYAWRREHRVILPLHGYEYALAGAAAALATRSAVLGFATLSYLVHLLADQAENRTRPLGYSLLFRACHGFRIERISTMPAAAKQGRLNDMAAIRLLLRRR